MVLYSTIPISRNGTKLILMSNSVPASAHSSTCSNMFSRAAIGLQAGGNEVPRQVNEIADYLDVRYVSAPEGIWRIFQFKMHNRTPAVQRLQIHLPNQQTVTFSKDTDVATLLDNNRLQKTTLTEYFTANKHTKAEAAATAATGRPPLEFDCRDLLYQEFPLQMTWHPNLRTWNPRKRGFHSTIGRVYFVGPSGGERFYLRLLLAVVRGSTSFKDLRTFSGVLYDNFKSACIARGLLDSDEMGLLIDGSSKVVRN